jgi:hypothetical protein
MWLGLKRHCDRPDADGRGSGVFLETCLRPGMAATQRSADLGLLLVRTDYSDDAAWKAALSAATALYDADDFERMGACLQPVESPELELRGRHGDGPEFGDGDLLGGPVASRTD